MARLEFNFCEILFEDFNVEEFVDDTAIDPIEAPLRCKARLTYENCGEEPSIGFDLAPWFKGESGISFAIEGRTNIDALRRYCEMALDDWERVTA